MERICFCLSDHPRRVLLTVFLLLSPLFSYFILYPFNIESDIRRGFAQKDGRSTEEFKNARMAFIYFTSVFFKYSFYSFKTD
uniref:Uncharacterized protein n=1 Tax=Heterorhabditis bacteriophora TaxID=37862 RepID=A0A1I7X8D9_HETBA